jgi:type IV secretory pathway VirB2 component (pilin)
MLNPALFRPRIIVLATTGQRRQVIDKLHLFDPATIRLMTALIMVGLLLVLPAGSALAQDEITTAFTEVVETITGIIQGLAVVVGIAGLSIWGLARIARPIFPELSNLTQQYIGSLVIGVIVVFVAATVVEGLASAVGG